MLLLSSVVTYKVPIILLVFIIICEENNCKGLFFIPGLSEVGKSLAAKRAYWVQWTHLPFCRWDCPPLLTAHEIFDRSTMYLMPESVEIRAFSIFLASFKRFSLMLTFLVSLKGDRRPFACAIPFDKRTWPILIRPKRTKSTVQETRVYLIY